MPRFPVMEKSKNRYKTGGPEVYYESEIWWCCRPWEVVLSTYTWDNEEERWKREEFWVRQCGICGEQPRPRLEERFRAG